MTSVLKVISLLLVLLRCCEWCITTTALYGTRVMGPKTSSGAVGVLWGSIPGTTDAHVPCSHG